MDAHFPAVELDNAIRFSTLSRMSGFLWQSSKWARRFGRSLRYMPGIEVLACSLDTDLNHVTTMLQLRPSLNHQVCGCILKGRYNITPAVLSPGPEALCWISGKMHKFLRSLAEYLAALAFYVVIIYLTHTLPAWLLALILHMCTSIHINFVRVYSLE